MDLNQLCRRRIVRDVTDFRSHAYLQFTSLGGIAVKITEQASIMKLLMPVAG